MTDFFHWSYSPASEALVFDPQLRKATTMMKLVVHGLKPLMEQLKSEDVVISDIQTFLGSMHGEIEPTVGFLAGLAQRDWARPFLFQNSLHHSTTGFASQQFHLLGPSYSVCSVRDPQKELLQMGLLMAGQMHKPALLIHAEKLSEEMAEITDYAAEESCELLYLSASAVNLLSQEKAFNHFREVCNWLGSV